MAQQHELLAVEADRRKTARAIINETAETMRKKPEHFIGRHTIYEARDENDPEDKLEETKVMDTTVRKKLDHALAYVITALDAEVSRDKTNTKAFADVVITSEDPKVKDIVLFKELPATMLLSLENHCAEWRKLFLSIPTLSPGRAWEASEGEGSGVYRDTQPERRNRTKKSVQSKVLVKATTEHPAQIEKWNEDIIVGAQITTILSGMFSPAEKSELLMRLDRLQAAIKQARMRANQAEVEQVQIGQTLVSYLLDGKS